MSEKKTTLVLGDLTALFSARSKNHKSINYPKLDETLKRVLGVDKYDSNSWFTLYRDDNEKQRSFVDGLRDLGWDVETYSSRDVRRLNDTRDYRFDAQIGYNIGLAVENFDRVVVVSDSYELQPIISNLVEDDPNVEAFLVFFSDSLDGRWWKEINREDSVVNFIDLEKELYED